MVRLKDCTFFMGHGFEYLLGFSGKYDFVIDFFLAKESIITLVRNIFIGLLSQRLLFNKTVFYSFSFSIIITLDPAISFFLSV